jgi:GNAT superfamily N-acetyltransferase
MADLVVQRLATLPTADLESLLAESREQEFGFLDTLVNEYTSGHNCFARPGEALFGVYHAGRLIAIGGLNCDPYMQTDGVGRVRHVYVLAGWRRQGVGAALMQAIVAEARRSFHLLTLRTLTPDADRFYRAIGFRPSPELAHATHCLDLAPARSLE